MFCNNCGKELEEGTAFCPSCGNNNNEEKKPQKSQINISDFKGMEILASLKKEILIPSILIVVGFLIPVFKLGGLPFRGMQEMVQEIGSEMGMITDVGNSVSLSIFNMIKMIGKIGGSDGVNSFALKASVLLYLIPVIAIGAVVANYMKKDYDNLLSLVATVASCAVCVLFIIVRYSLPFNLVFKTNFFFWIFAAGIFFNLYLMLSGLYKKYSNHILSGLLVFMVAVLMVISNAFDTAFLEMFKNLL